MKTKKNFKGLNYNRLLIVISAVLSAASILPVPTLAKQITRVSTASDGTQAIDGSGVASISADGRYVVFASSANNLVAGDTNLDGDIFVKDLKTQQITLVSDVRDGSQDVNGYGNGLASISADGRYVAFESSAFDYREIFVKDLKTKQITQVTRSPTGLECNLSTGSINPLISADGRYVVFESYNCELVAGDTNDYQDIFVADLKTKQIMRVSEASNGRQANHFSESASISADGRYVAFTSFASNLVPGDTNEFGDVFIKDLKTKQLTRVSVKDDGTQSNFHSLAAFISSDGRYVSFLGPRNWAEAGTETGAFLVKDMKTQKFTIVPKARYGAQGYGLGFVANPTISADNRLSVYASRASNLVAGDTNGKQDIFLRDRWFQTGAGEVDLSVKQTVSAAAVSVGATVHYTATITNLSDSTSAKEVTLTGFAPVSGEVSAPLTISPSQGVCDTGLIIVCRLKAIAPGQQATVAVEFTAIKPGTVANRVVINTGNVDPVYSNDSAITSVSVVP